MRHVNNLDERVWKESRLELSPSTFLAENWIILARRHLWKWKRLPAIVKSQPPGSTLTIWLVLPNRQTKSALSCSELVSRPRRILCLTVPSTRNILIPLKGFVCVHIVVTSTATCYGLCSCTCCTIFNCPLRRPCWWQLLLRIGMVIGKSHTLKRCPRPWTFQSSGDWHSARFNKPLLRVSAGCNGSAAWGAGVLIRSHL